MEIRVNGDELFVKGNAAEVWKIYGFACKVGNEGVGFNRQENQNQEMRNLLLKIKELVTTNRRCCFECSEQDWIKLQIWLEILFKEKQC